MKSVKIVHLYPRELGLYGDRGNVLCLVKRLEARGFSPEVKEIGTGSPLFDFDILFIGGGQDREMKIISRDLRRKAEALSYAIESGRTVLAICGGFQLLGEYYKTAGGEIIKLSGALPFYTEGGMGRMVGNVVFETPFGTVGGFENHSGKTYLSEPLSPLGRVIRGFGNNGCDGTEGVLYKNTFCTYAHGPVLPKNPALADGIIRRAVKTELAPLDDREENRCHKQIIRF